MPRQFKQIVAILYLKTKPQAKMHVFQILVMCGPILVKKISTHSTSTELAGIILRKWYLHSCSVTRYKLIIAINNT